jgi:2-polyprenyl-3-methyl-5-hydroxy-6-metoxy-1,4-benzoquinol methylase
MHSIGPNYIAEEVASHIADDKNAKVMDIACGTGIMGKKVSPV